MGRDTERNTREGRSVTYFMRQVGRVCLSIGLCGVISAGAVETRWAQIEAGMGEIQLDGSLKYQFLLGSSEPLALLGVRVNLVHHIDTDAKGRARSVWRVSGLQTSLTPSGRTQLRWQPLSGAVVDFDKAKVSTALSHSGDGDKGQWMIREVSSGCYDIHSLDGEIWHYELGVLRGITHPSLGELRVSTQGGWITRIERGDRADGVVPLLEASYSADGRLLSLRIGGGAQQGFTWSGAELVAWRNEQEEVFRWSYANGLLSIISEPGGAKRSILWRENKGFDRGDSRWVFPVHLARVSDENYGYKLTSQGFVITRENRVSGLKIKTRFNPLRYRLEQQMGAQRLTVTFRKTSPGRGAVERIEDARAGILEEYRYDEGGRLVEMWREGEPALRFRYDNLGRLISAAGDEIP